MNWRVAHFRKVRVSRKSGSTYWETPVAADGKGFFDLVLVRDRVIWAELKTDTGSTRPEQHAWHKAVRDAGGEVYLWRPSMWASIAHTLAKRCGSQ
jgi:hypothetical protein